MNSLHNAIAITYGTGWLFGMIYAGSSFLNAVAHACVALVVFRLITYTLQRFDTRRTAP
jgi:hypothetical protein